MRSSESKLSEEEKDVLVFVGEYLSSCECRCICLGWSVSVFKSVARLDGLAKATGVEEENQETHLRVLTRLFSPPPPPPPLVDVWSRPRGSCSDSKEEEEEESIGSRVERFIRAVSSQTFTRF